jgi:hypothetical protein
MPQFDWQAAAKVLNLSPSDVDISTPIKFMEAQIVAHTALLSRIKRLEAKIKTYEQLLSN